MKRYVEFWHKGVMTDKLIPACGSDSIYYLDARQSDSNQHAQAAKLLGNVVFQAIALWRILFATNDR